MPPKTIKQINQDFFKTWSSKMAYVLGYFVADGCISVSEGRKNNPYTFNITSVDLYHLGKIKKALKSEYKISKKSGSSNNIAYQIQVRNLILCRDLIELGIYPRKTYNLGPIKILDKYFSDFVRGFFDGDGSVYIQKVNGTLQIKSSFVAVSPLFIQDFNKCLCKALGVKEKSIHKQIDKKGERLVKYDICFYIDDSEKLAEFMYGNNSTLYLKRKKDIFEKWKLIKRRHYIKKNYPSKIGWQLNQFV